MSSKFAVIILNYLAHEDTFICIKSVLNELDAHIFIVDNSKDIVEKNFLLKKYEHNGRIEFLFPHKNLGFSAGVNFALQRAISLDYQKFLLLNNDAVLMNGFGNTLIQSFLKNPSSLISTNINWGGELIGFKYYHRLLGITFTQDMRSSNTWVPFLTGCTLAFDKTVFDTLGIFDEDFFMYGEDVDFSFRAAQAGLPLILLDNDVWVIHSGSKSAKNSSYFYEYHVARGHLLLVKKMFKNPINVFLVFILKIITLFIRAMLRCFRFKSLIPAIALLTAPFNLKIRPSQSR